MSRGRIRAVIIGCGRIAGGYDTPKSRSRGKIRTHIKAYLSDPRFEVTAVCDKDRRGAERFCRHWGVPRAYTDAGKMLRAERPAVVSVCTPTATHAKVLAEVARHPVKLVFAEKPFTDNPAEARRLAALYKRRKISVAVNYLRRWCPNHRRLKQIIESGRLGALRCVDAYYKGDLLAIGSHLIDLIGFLGGKVTGVESGNRLCIDREIVGVIEHGKRDNFILEMLFERGMIRVENYGYAGRCVAWTKGSGGPAKLKTVFKFGAPNRGIDLALGRAVRNLGDHLSRRKQLASGLQNALETLSVCSALSKSARSGRFVGFKPRP